MKPGKKKSHTVQLNTPSGRKTLPLSDALSLASQAANDKQWQRVIALCDEILQQVPGSEEARLLRYQSLSAQGRFDELCAACEAHINEHPRNLLSREYMAHSLRQLGREQEALPHLEHAVALAKTTVRLINALGTLYKELGNPDQAQHCFDKVIAIKPGSGKAWWNRSDLNIEHERAIAQMEAQLKRLADHSAQRPYFHFALYRSYEATGNVEQAFHHLQQGNKRKKALLDYRVENDLEQDQKLIHFFVQHFGDLKQKVASFDSGAMAFSPIFIVGMPRSGTSLVEQILASHQDVTGCGEIATLPQATEQVLRQNAVTAPFPECLTTLPASQLLAIGERYQQLTGDLLHGRTRLTDKFLLNYKALPLISLVLPQAKIIHVARNPMDTCFGCYRQLFNQGLGFSYDLDDLAKTFLGYRSMMATWRDLPGVSFHTLEYENLVQQPDTEISRLLTYCGLSDEPACQRFFDTERTVKTVSNLQVRQPVFQSGLDRWRRYEKHLGSLKTKVDSPLS